MVKVLLFISLVLLFSCKKEVITYPAAISKSSIVKNALTVETKTIQSLDSKIYDEWKNIENGKANKEEITFYKHQAKMKVKKGEKEETTYFITPEDRYSFLVVNAQNGHQEVWSYYISYDDNKNLVLFLRSENQDSYKLYRLRSELTKMGKVKKFFFRKDKIE